MVRGVLGREGEAFARPREALARELDAPARERLPLELLDAVPGDDERVDVLRLEERLERDFDPEAPDFVNFVSPFSARILLTVRAATSAWRPL